ncbi:MAG: DarT ssDNA thymidine ADP-ribosyltransferase family protein [Actinomycetota bacterium]
MKRYELQELHHITAIENTASILQDGILSHERSRGVVHRSLSKQLVQELRGKVVVPGGRRLHEYANLYICARNPTLRKMISDVKAQRKGRPP